MKKYKCSSCGYIFDEDVENPEFGIKPPYDIENMPEDWVCPTCGASKHKFETCKENGDKSDS